MDTREPRVSSFDQLARSCLAHGDWPAGVQPKARSLAALFSKFDRGIEVDWLEDRAQAQVALARVLRCPLSVLQGHVRKHVQVVHERSQHYRLPEAPFARFVELASVALPPTLPLELSHPQMWRRHWWRTQPGDGLELVQRWLAARESATPRTLGHWSELTSALDSPGPLLLSLPEPLPLGVRIPERGGLCVCSPHEAPVDFVAVQTPALASVLRPLVLWLTQWFEVDGRLKPDLAFEWFEQALQVSVLDGFDAAVGLAAAFDELGHETVRGRPFDAVASQWLERRFTESEVKEASSESGWPKARTLELLTRMAYLTVLESAPDWGVARPLAEWSRLVPAEIRRALDARSAHSSLAHSAEKLTVEQLEGSLRRERARDDHALRGLLAARCLSPVSGDQFRFSPRWIANVAKQGALLKLGKSAVDTWGQALLGEHHSQTRELLTTQMLQGDRQLLDALLEREDDSSPAAVIGMETLAAVVGDCILRGAPFEEAQLAGLFSLQVSTLAKAPNSSIAPRLLCRQQDSSAFTSWQLSWWAIAEQVSRTPLQCPAQLDPWGAASAPSPAELDRILHYLSTRALDAYSIGAYALLGRLYQHETEALRSHPVLLPAHLSTDSPWQDWVALSRLPHGLAALHALQPAATWPRLAACAWAAWLGADLQESGSELFTAEPHASQLLWPHIPERVLLRLLNTPRRVTAHIPWASLTREHCGAVLNAEWETLPEVTYPLFDCIAEELVPLAANWAARRDESIPWHTLWKRFPERMLELSLQLFEQGKGEQSAALLRKAPSAERPRVIRALSLIPVNDWAQDCLHAYIVERQEGWTEAYATYLKGLTGG